MAINSFDKKFGAGFLKGLPLGPGIYRVFDNAQKLIYVGKAKNLRRRLSQYRHAKRLKKHAKMRSIIKGAARIEFEVCATELDAFLLETQLIQANRPHWNVAGAYHFMYPMIGMKLDLGTLYFCYTTQPSQFTDYEFHGAYRSRSLTGDAFFSLMCLLAYIGHSVPRKKLADSRRHRFSRVFAFRQISEKWLTQFTPFWKGESKEALEELVLSLVENAGARQARHEVQEHLENLVRFWKHEALTLAKARRSTGYAVYPVPQAERDFIFLKHRHGKRSSRTQVQTHPI